MKTILFVLGIMLVYAVLDFALTDDTEHQTRVNFHDFYNLETVDGIFIGTSHTVNSANAVKLSDDTGGSFFNLASANQDAAGSYYVLRAALEAHDEISRVYYEISPSRLMKDAASETAAFIISDYIRSPAIKAEMILKSMGPESYVKALFRLRRSINPLSNPPGPGTIKRIVSAKLSDDYRNYTGSGACLGRGQWINGEAWSETEAAAVNINSQWLDSFSTEDISPNEWNYMLQIMQLCRDRNIKLTLYVAPYTRYYLMRADGMEAVTGLVRQAAYDNGADFIDFNLIRDEYFHVDSRDFANLDHISYTSADKLTDFLELYESEPDGDYFCSSLSEKYPDSGEVIYAGYEIAYLSGENAYFCAEDAEAEIDSVRITVSAVASSPVEAVARIFRAERSAESGKWEKTAEIPGNCVNGFETEFLTAADGLNSMYIIQLFSPGTDNMIFETVTGFDMQ